MLEQIFVVKVKHWYGMQPSIQIQLQFRSSGLYHLKCLQFLPLYKYPPEAYVSILHTYVSKVMILYVNYTHYQI